MAAVKRKVGVRVIKSRNFFAVVETAIGVSCFMRRWNVCAVNLRIKPLIKIQNDRVVKVCLSVVNFCIRIAFLHTSVVNCNLYFHLLLLFAPIKRRRVSKCFAEKLAKIVVVVYTDLIGNVCQWLVGIFDEFPCA